MRRKWTDFIGSLSFLGLNEGMRMVFDTLFSVFSRASTTINFSFYSIVESNKRR